MIFSFPLALSLVLSFGLNQRIALEQTAKETNKQTNSSAVVCLKRTFIVHMSPPLALCGAAQSHTNQSRRPRILVLKRS